MRTEMDREIGCFCGGLKQMRLNMTSDKSLSIQDGTANEADCVLDVQLSPDYLLLQKHMDLPYYLDQFPRDKRPEDPVQYYLETGSELSRDPTVDFSTRFYLERSPDVAQAQVNPFLHYLKWGKLEGRLPHPAYLPGLPDSGADGPEITLMRRDFDVEF